MRDTGWLALRKVQGSRRCGRVPSASRVLTRVAHYEASVCAPGVFCVLRSPVHLCAAPPPMCVAQAFSLSGALAAYGPSLGLVGLCPKSSHSSVLFFDACCQRVIIIIMSAHVRWVAKMGQRLRVAAGAEGGLVAGGLRMYHC
jgi:hypothetical protein